MGNKDRNSYVRNAITEATVRLLGQNDLAGISVSQIVAEARVSRNSFYRNFASKEDILGECVHGMLDGWEKDWKASGDGSNAHMYGSLFGHFERNAEFYLLLRRRGLFRLVLDALLRISGPKPGLPNTWAYTTAFISYGTYGWIEEWLTRGMQESADEMAALLAAGPMAQ